MNKIKCMVLGLALQNIVCAALSVSVDPSTKTLSTGESVTITASASGAEGTASYEWSPSGAGSTKSYTAITADVGTTKTFTVTCSDGVCPPATASATVHVAKVEFDSVTGADSIGSSGGSEVYACATQSGDAIVKLKITPTAADASQLPITWTGGSDGGSKLQRKISLSSLSSTGIDVEAKLDSASLVKIKLYILPAKPTAVTLDTSELKPKEDSSISIPGTAFGVAQIGSMLSAVNEYIIYYEGKEWKFIYKKISHETKWRTQSRGRTNVDNPTANPFPVGMNMIPFASESAKKTQAKADLTPDSIGWAPQDKYWAQAIVERHEKFHVSDFKDDFLLTELSSAKTDIEAVAVPVATTNLDPTTALSDKKIDLDNIVKTSIQDALSDFSLGAEARAFGDGKSSFESLSNSIVP